MKIGQPITVVKSNGEREPFNVLKLEHSLLSAGASPSSAQKIISVVQNELVDNMTTTEIYRHAFFLLRKMEKPSAVRYSMRRALTDLGPSGFPFEKFVAEIFKAQGYIIETDKMIRGYCAEHELDVIAYNDKKLIMTEVKFHNQNGIKTDLKVALYVKARFDDIRKMHFHYGGRDMILSEGLLVTNTKFTKSAISYAMCAGVGMVGWNYPVHGNLHDLIVRYKMHPITSLTTLSLDEKKYLISRGFVICSTVMSKLPILHEGGFSQKRINAIIEEIRAL
jgi:ATP cone domain/Restriction endonuclease